MARWWDTDGDGFDLLLTPTLAEPPPLLGDIDSDAPDASHALARIVPFGVFTAPFNITGQPAISVPTGSAGACRSACNSWPPRAGKMCCSAWRRSSNRYGRGQIGHRRSSHERDQPRTVTPLPRSE